MAYSRLVEATLPTVFDPASRRRKGTTQLMCEMIPVSLAETISEPATISIAPRRSAYHNPLSSECKRSFSSSPILVMPNSLPKLIVLVSLYPGALESMQEHTQISPSCHICKRVMRTLNRHMMFAHPKKLIHFEMSTSSPEYLHSPPIISSTCVRTSGS